MSDNSKPARGPAALVVLGLDTGKRAHASQFGAADVALATKAAGLMGMFALPVETDEVREIAAKLPQGKVFASGSAFVPFVSMPVYEKLLALGEATGRLQRPSATALAADNGEAAGGAAEAASDDAETGPSFTLPSSWAAIETGSLVLVTEDGDGWWEAVVTAVANPDAPIEERLLTLQFRDFPDYQRQVRRLVDVALLHPAAETGEDGGDGDPAPEGQDGSATVEPLGAPGEHQPT